MSITRLVTGYGDFEYDKHGRNSIVKSQSAPINRARRTHRQRQGRHVSTLDSRQRSVIYTMDHANDRSLRRNPPLKPLTDLATDTSSDPPPHPGGISVNFFIGAEKSSIKAYMQMSRRPPLRQLCSAWAASARYAISIRQ